MDKLTWIFGGIAIIALGVILYFWIYTGDNTTSPGTGGSTSGN